MGPDHTRERLDRPTEMLELARRAGDPELELQARNWRVLDLMESGDGAALRAELNAYAALATQGRLRAYAWYVPVWRAVPAMIEGRPDEGLELARRARELGRAAGDGNADVFYAEHILLRLIVTEAFAETELQMPADRAHSGPAWRAYALTATPTATGWSRRARGSSHGGSVA